MSNIKKLKNLISDTNLNDKQEIEKIIEGIERKNKNKKYGIVWEEKEENVKEELRRKFIYLEEDVEKEIKSSIKGPTNLLIEGDNLYALNSLVYTHKGCIDVIIIDPPYNTGNRDFKYNDCYVDKEDSYRHSKWLSFMNKRLSLAKNLLSNDGVIFINIDENELSQLKLLCDEIFNEENLLGIITVVNNLKGRSDKGFFATANEFLLCYSKKHNEVRNKIKGRSLSIEELKEYKFEDEISKYKEIPFRKTGKDSKREDRPNMYYPIFIDQDTKEIYIERNKDTDIEIYPINQEGDEGRWRWEKKRLEKDKNTEIVVRKNQKGEWTILTKMRNIVGDEERTKKAKTIWQDAKYDSSKGTKLIKEILWDGAFDNPKPLDLIIDILRISTNKNSCVLDFFAGSGTTGHAVLQLNKEDDGNRKFILCTNNEIDEKTEKEYLCKNEYLNVLTYEKFKKTIEYELVKQSEGFQSFGICKRITYPRLSKVINGYPYNGKEKEVLYEKEIKKWSQLKKAQKYVQEAIDIKEEHNYDGEIKISFKDGKLLVTKEKNIDKYKEGIDANLKYYKVKSIEKTDNYEMDEENLLNKTKELVQIKEDVFNVLKSNDKYSIFDNSKKAIGLYHYFKLDKKLINEMLEDLIKNDKEEYRSYPWIHK